MSCKTLGQWSKKIGALLCVCLLIISCLPISASAAETGLSQSDIELLQSHGVYVVGYSEDYLPFSYVDENGNLVGMAISVMDYITQMVEIEVEYISVSEARETGTVVDINLAILYEDQLEENTTISSPYTNLQMMAVGRGDTLEVDGAMVGHLPYSTISDEDIEGELAGCTAVTYYSYAALGQAYVDGEIDYMLVTSLMATQMQGTASKSFQTDIRLEVAVSYHDQISDGQVEVFDRLLARLDTNYIYSLMLGAVLDSADNAWSAVQFVEEYTAEAMGIALVLVIIVALVVNSIMNAKRRLLLHTLNVDDLTGLMTERKFLEESEEILKGAQPGVYSVVSVDIDNFKAINEVYGYEVGTQTIRHFAQRIQEIEPEALLVARVFGDNFLLLTNSVIPEVAQYHLHQDTWSTDVGFAKLLGIDYRLMTSAGIYVINDPTLPMTYMIDCANMARRRSKETYGRTQTYFTEEYEVERTRKNTVISSMEQAMERGEFKIHYQPKIDFKTKKLIGAEALVRWYKGEGVQIYPGEFIPIFEENGFIIRLDYYVIDTVCQFLRKNPEIAKISVNLSGFTLLEENLVEEILQITQRNEVSPNRLEIEITESAVVSDFPRVKRQTAELKAQGFSISMDDFGAGLSSLNRLKDLDIDVLKIDQVFLGHDGVSQRSASILNSIIQMSRNLGIVTVAEGVETREQEELLERLQCDIAQGYYYARPLPEERYLEYVHSREVEGQTNNI